MQVNRSDEERLKQCTLGTNQLEVEPKCLILVRREFQVVPAAGMKKALMLGRTARELALFRDVEEDRSGEVETRTTRVHAERLELITDGMDGGEQRTEAWIAGRWQPVVLHPDRGWVDRSIGESGSTGALEHWTRARPEPGGFNIAPTEGLEQAAAEPAGTRSDACDLHP